MAQLSQKINHIAVIRLSAMGDVAMTVPVLYALATQNPGLKITMISRPFFKPLFDGLPNVEFFPFDLNEKTDGFFGLIRFYNELKKLDFDAFADLHNVIRSKILRKLFAINGIKTAAVDKGKVERAMLTRTNNKVFKPITPMVQRHVAVFKELGFEVSLSNANVLHKMTLNKNVTSLSGMKSGMKWIGIAPFAKHESKVYPKDLMKQAIDLLAIDPNYKLFLFGSGKSEVDILNAFAADKNNIVVVAGKLSFEEELQLISNLDTMLSMDSGNAHIAAIYGVNTVTLWGATHPYSGFAPFGQPLENAMTSDRDKFPDLPTSVYGNKKIKGYEDAMRTISPETIVKKIEVFLQKS